MKIKHYNLKFSLLFFYTNRLKQSKYKNYKLLITTPFGFVKGIPDFDIPLLSTNADFIEYVYDNNRFIRDYMAVTIREHELLKKNESEKDEYFYPLLNDDDIVVIKNATICTNGNILHLDSFTLFIDSISGISFVKE